jgi:hypothetical protein
MPDRPWGRLFLIAALLAAGCAAPPTDRLSTAAQVDNTQITFDTIGARVDAHDGTVVQDADGTAWQVGTAYGCGFQLNITSPYCGVRVYRSDDLQTWAPAGAVGGMLAFDPFTAAPANVSGHLRIDPGRWQRLCGGQSFGCFRPHLARRPSDGQWVMWLNVPSLAAGYVVFLANRPGGPYREFREPVLAAHDGSTRLGGGDMDLAVEGADAWLAYVTVGPGNTPADIVVERLDAQWTSGTGQMVRLGVPMAESPSLFRRGALWYLLYSAAAPYGITSASYATAPSPLGPWTLRGQISARSCEGQSADVDLLTAPSGTQVAVWQVDRWAQTPSGHGAANQYRANTYLAPLTFNADGTIPPQGCLANWTFT